MCSNHQSHETSVGRSSGSIYVAAALLVVGAIGMLAFSALGGRTEPSGEKFAQADKVFATDALTGARDGAHLARTAHERASHAALRTLARQLEARERDLLANRSLEAAASRTATGNPRPAPRTANDSAIIDDLIRHRQADAITAEIQLRTGGQQALRSLARSLLGKASLDIETLNGLHKEWYDANSPAEGLP